MRPAIFIQSISSAVIVCTFAMPHDADAATCDAQAGGNTVKYELYQSTPENDKILDVSCFDSVNDTDVVDKEFEIFGKTGWLLGETFEGQVGDIGLFPDDNLEDRDFLKYFIVGDISNVESAFIAINQSITEGEKSFAAFLFDLSDLDPNVPLVDVTSSLNGIFTTNVFTSENCFDFTGTPQSQCVVAPQGSVYYRERVPAPVPLPASGLVLLTGVAGLAALRRRSQQP